jgi:hypothetical protein
MEYFLHRDGQQWGPYDEATLRSMLAAQQIVPNDLIGNEQMPDLATVESVFPTAAPTPAVATNTAPPEVTGSTPISAAGKSAATATVQPSTATEPDKKGPGKKTNIPKIAAIAGAGLVVVVFCFFIFRTTSPEPRSQDEIFLKRESLPALFITAQTRKRITAPGNKQFFIDKESQEICWRAMICFNPKCPALKTGGKPPIFINPNPSVFIKADGTIGQAPARALKAAKAGPLVACPECLKTRTVNSESREAKEKYLSWVQPYVLPETIKRIKELEAEQTSRSEVDNAN